MKWAKRESAALEKINPFTTNEVRIYSVTWNLAGKTPTVEHLHGLLHPRHIYHDIYVISTQEALKSILGSMFKPSKEVMNRMI